MLFMTYRPKTAKNVKAEQVTEKNLDEISAAFFGMAVVVKKEDAPPYLKIATFNGVLEAEINSWIVRTDEGVEVWGNAEFNEKYERARNTREG